MSAEHNLCSTKLSSNKMPSQPIVDYFIRCKDESVYIPTGFLLIILFYSPSASRNKTCEGTKRGVGKDCRHLSLSQSTARPHAVGGKLQFVDN